MLVKLDTPKGDAYVDPFEVIAVRPSLPVNKVREITMRGGSMLTIDNTELNLAVILNSYQMTPVQYQEFLSHVQQRNTQ